MANGIRAEYAKRAEANTIRQDDLFGADETFNTEMALRAKYAGDQIARINLDLRALKIVSGKQSGNVAAKDSLLKKYNIKGPDDSAGIERAIQELETLHRRWQHYYTDAELSKEADAFVKKSLRLDPEDQPPVPLDPKGNPITPESQWSGAAPHQDANQPISESANQPAAPAASLGSPAAQTSGEAANVPTQSLPEIPHGINDEQANGPRFVPLAKGDNFQEIEKTTRERKKNEESHTTTSSVMIPSLGTRATYPKSQPSSNQAKTSEHTNTQPRTSFHSRNAHVSPCGKTITRPQAWEAGQRRSPGSSHPSSSKAVSTLPSSHNTNPSRKNA